MRRNTLLLALLGTGVLLGLAVLGQQYFIGDETPLESPASVVSPAPPPVVQRAESPDASTNQSVRRLTVGSSGTLERLEHGEWRALAAGDELSVADRIRSITSGRSNLNAGDGSVIELVDEVEISVEALTRSLAELELHRGRLRANLGDRDGLALRVRSSGATAEARSGAFVVYADGTGMVAVASETAEVRLRAREREVVVGAGEQSIVQPGSPPGVPEEIPDEVFLNVAWPERRIQRERRIVIRGEVHPGTAVRVAGERVPVQHDGVFETTVALDAGPNQVVVEATDPLGRQRSTESPPVIVKNRPPPIEVLSPGRWGDAGSR